MFLNKKRSSKEFYNIGKGKVIALASVEDEIISKNQMGNGYALDLDDSKVYSPVDGIVKMVFFTGHAYAIKMDNDVEVLIHIGVDTVELKGEGFTPHVITGQRVKHGDVLATVDLELVKKSGKSLITPVLITSRHKTIISKIGEEVDQDTTGILTLDF